MISLGKSSTSTHILAGDWQKSLKAICGFAFQAPPQELLEVDGLKDVLKRDRLCERCRLRAEDPYLRRMHGIGAKVTYQARKADPWPYPTSDPRVLRVRLGKCQEMSPCLHVMPDLETPFGTPLCNQGHVKLAVGAVPTYLTVPEGDVSQVRVEGGPVCSKCLKILQGRIADGKEPAAGVPASGPEAPQRDTKGEGSPKSAPPARPAPAAAAASGSSAATGEATAGGTPSKNASMLPQHLKHWKSQVTELKHGLMTGEVSKARYDREVRPLVAKIREVEPEW